MKQKPEHLRVAALGDELGGPISLAPLYSGLRWGAALIVALLLAGLAWAILKG